MNVCVVCVHVWVSVCVRAFVCAFAGACVRAHPHTGLAKQWHGADVPDELYRATTLTRTKADGRLVGPAYHIQASRVERAALNCSVQ